MRYIPALLATSLFLGSCCNSCKNEMTRYHEDGRAKPIVAVASMIDTTSFDIPWSLSEELTSMIVKKIASEGTIFVHATDDFSPTENPFAQDLSWVKREFQSQEFVVFLELIQHDLVPALKGKKAPASTQELATDLNMSVRMRVVDLRGHSPKIVLQEMIRESYYIPRSLLPTDYNLTTWGSDQYRSSPMGIAHSQLVHEVSKRLSDYILLAKCRSTSLL